jgi:hypothetical protein
VPSNPPYTRRSTRESLLPSLAPCTHAPNARLLPLAILFALALPSPLGCRQSQPASQPLPNAAAQIRIAPTTPAPRPHACERRQRILPTCLPAAVVLADLADEAAALDTPTPQSTANSLTLAPTPGRGRPAAKKTHHHVPSRLPPDGLTLTNRGATAKPPPAMPKG